MVEANAISTTLREEIAANRYESRLPPVRELMKRFGATQFAVQSAMETLKREGFVETQVGRGTFVIGRSGNDRAEAADKVRVLLLTHVMTSGRGDEIAAAIYDDLSGRGCSAVSISYNDTSSIQSLLGQSRFDLCVLQPRRSIISSAFIASVKQCARHVIVEGRFLERMDVDIVLRDRFASVALAVDHLRDLGHERIGLLSERSGAAGYDEVERIFALHSSARRAPSAPIIAVDWRSGETGTEAMEKALRDPALAAKDRPTAFIVSGRFSGRDIRDAFSGAGMDIPGDASIVRLRAVDDVSRAGGFFTSVARRPRQIADAIRELIEWRLANPNALPVARFDQPQISVRQSTAPPAKAAKS